MKIAFLHMTMGLVDRGSEISTHLLASALSEKHEVLVIGAGKLKDTLYQYLRRYPLSAAPPPAPATFIDKILFRLHLNPATRLAQAFTLTSLPALRRFKPDIIIATNGANQLHLIKKNLPHTPTVVFGRAGIGHDDLATLHARPDLFIALTPTAHTWASVRSHPNTRVIYLPNPINTTPFKHVKPADLTLPHPRLLIVGALTRYKNIPSVIRALSTLNASLILIGDGEDHHAVSQELSRFTGEFTWLKHVAPPDLPSYYQGADAFCLTPDSQEAFGRVYLEAMAVGLPIVATDDEARRGIIGPRGFYANPHQPDALARALASALTSVKINYQKELKPYLLTTVTKQLAQELHDLTN